MLQYLPSLLFAILTLTPESAAITDAGCEVRVHTQAGWVCGRQKYSDKYPYASFHVPYARQPTGDLRFKELQPLEPWDGLYDATKAGPICPQTSDLFRGLLTIKNMSEACIYANIHVPLQALPDNTIGKPTEKNCAGLPILVYIHDGGFISGSGETDFHGPEYLIKEEIIIITYNYRISSLGFLSLNTPSMPGNNGMRDSLTLLKWVQANARNFGGNPHDVTLGGHSAGGVITHLFTLSKATKGLFKRGILLSGVGIRSFCTTSPQYAKKLANSLISYLGINATDPEEIYQRLVSTPLDVLMNASAKVELDYGPNSFSPVVETRFENITTIIEEDPETLVSNGHGNNIPLIIGFVNHEEGFFNPSFQESNVLDSIDKNPLMMLPPVLANILPNERAMELARQTKNRYFNGTPTVEKFGKFYADYSFVYPALKLAQLKASMKSAPVYLYHFSYNPDFSPVKATRYVEYDGAAHTDDHSFIFRTNSMEGVPGFEPPTCKDSKMRRKMSFFVKNFMTCNNPICDKCESPNWPAQESQSPLRYENIMGPEDIYYTTITEDQKDTFQYFDSIYNEVYNAESM